ncbi:hypothetical protein ABWJ16_002001 [Vibrio alginolyticus]
MKTVKNSNISLYVSIIAFTLFFPGMVNTFGLLFEQGLTILLFFISFFFICIYRSTITKNTLHTSFLIYAYFQFAIVVSLFRSTDIIITGDLVEIVKPLYLYLFFILPFCFIRRVEDIYIVVKYLMLFCVILSIYGIIEAWTSFGYKISTLLYKPDRSVLKNKAVASFIITYTFASFLVLPFFYFLTRYIVRKSYINKELILSLVILICVFSTQSKTVFISLIVTLSLYFIFCLKYKFTVNKRKLTIILFSLVILLLVGVSVLASLLSTHFAYIYNGLEVVFITLMDKGFAQALYSTPSISLRIEQFEFALEAQDSIPLIGVAIGKAVLMPESLYALYLYRAGTIGIFIHLSMVVYLFFSAKKCAKFFSKDNDKTMYCWFIAVHFYALSLPLSYFSSAVNDQTRTGFIFYFLLASTIFVRNIIRNHARTNFYRNASI